MPPHFNSKITHHHLPLMSNKLCPQSISHYRESMSSDGLSTKTIATLYVSDLLLIHLQNLLSFSLSEPCSSLALSHTMPLPSTSEVCYWESMGWSVSLVLSVHSGVPSAQRLPDKKHCSLSFVMYIQIHICMRCVSTCCSLCAYAHRQVHTPVYNVCNVG